MRTSAIVTAACFSLIAVAVAADGRASMRKRTEIPAQRLETALQALAQDRNLQVICRSDLIGDLRTSGASGDLTADELLARLLSGTGLTYHYLNDRAITIVPLTESSTLSQDAGEQARGDDQSVWNRFRLAQVNQAISGETASPGLSNEGTSQQTPVTLEEIVVTAQKRAERLQDVPISMTVLSGAALDRSTFVSTEDALATVPGLATKTDFETGGTQLSLRGVSSSAALVGGATPVAFYVDGAPFSLIRSAFVPDMDIYDLQRIEVLSGPQGTLYGASALNGVIRILTNDPDLHDFDFKGRATVSTTEHGGENYDGDMAVNIPIIDGKLGMRVVAGDEHQSGFIDAAFGNHINSQDIGTDRLKIYAQPTDTLSIGLSAWHSQVSSASSPLSDSNYNNVEGHGSPDYNAFDQYGLNINNDFQSFSVSSVTSYLTYTDIGNADLTINGPPNGDNLIYTLSRSKVYSEELNFTSKLDGPWKWSAGMFYRNAEDYYFQNLVYFPALTVQIPSNINFLDAFSDTSKSEAVYGEIGRSFFDDRLELAAGVRYFHDNEDSEPRIPPQDVTPGGVPNIGANAKSTATTPRAILSWKPSGDLTTYLSYGQGFRSGVPQDYLIETVFPYPAAKPDKLTNYEIGVKGDILDHTLSYTVAAFYIDWKGVQQRIDILEPDGIGFVALINGQSASGPGAEFAITARPTSSFEVSTSFSWNDLTFDHDVYSGGSPIFLKGDRLSTSPEFTAGLSAQYTFPLGPSGLQGQLSASENYTSPLDTVDLDPVLGETTADQANSMLIARAKFSILMPAHWTWTLFADNLTNSNGAITRDSASQSKDLRVTPRVVGMRVDYHLK